MYVVYFRNRKHVLCLTNVLMKHLCVVCDKQTNEAPFVLCVHVFIHMDTAWIYKARCR